MVVSNINSNVSYPERKTIDEDDKGQDVSMFQIKLFEIDVVIALGNVKYNFANDNVVYCPVYIIVDESDKIYQIGVYEILKKKYDKGKYLDEDGDLDISKLQGPLLYTFVDKSYIKTDPKRGFVLKKSAVFEQYRKHGYELNVFQTDVMDFCSLGYFSYCLTAPYRNLAWLSKSGFDFSTKFFVRWE